MEVLGREIEVAGAELLNHPRDLVDWCPPARCPPAPAVHNPLRPVRLIGIAQPAKVPLAHPQQLRCLHAAQLPRLMQPNRIDDPGHSDLRQHAIPPAQTGQIVCYQTRTYRVPPTRPAIVFWQPMASKVTMQFFKESVSSSAGIAVISFDLPSTSRWPSTKPCWLAQALGATAPAPGRGQRSGAASCRRSPRPRGGRPRQ